MQSVPVRMARYFRFDGGGCGRWESKDMDEGGTSQGHPAAAFVACGTSAVAPFVAAVCAEGATHGDLATPVELNVTARELPSVSGPKRETLHPSIRYSGKRGQPPLSSRGVDARTCSPAPTVCESVPTMIGSQREVTVLNPTK